jgi:transposase
LVDLQQQARNQVHALAQEPVVVASVQTRLQILIQTLTDQIGVTEREINDVLRQDDAWAAAAVRLQTIVGVGMLTAAWLLVTTLNFTLCENATEAAAYAGLAPHAHQSGTSVRGRTAIGHTGNAHLRRARSLATFSATWHNPPPKTFYDCLPAAGKPMKVARCATAHKLLHIAWAVVTKDCDFDPTHHARDQAKYA